jgi:hypothetical protein
MIETWRFKEMNWKKLLLVAIVAGGVVFATVPRSNAGVAIGIGLGFPVVYPYPYYGYPYRYPYPYYGYYGPSAYVGPSFYWSNGHRIYYRGYRRGYHRHWR